MEFGIWKRCEMLLFFWPHCPALLCRLTSTASNLIYLLEHLEPHQPELSSQRPFTAGLWGDGGVYRTGGGGSCQQEEVITLNGARVTG